MRTRVYLGEAANREIVDAALTSLPDETGGILVGYHEDAAIVVTRAIVVAPTKRSGNRYTRGRQAAEAALHHYLLDRETEDPIGYVGEWHSHPGPAKPSKIDIAAIEELARQAHSPLALLVVSPSVGSTIAAMVAAPSRGLLVRVARAQLIDHPAAELGAPRKPTIERMAVGATQIEHAKTDQLTKEDAPDAENTI